MAKLAKKKENHHKDAAIQLYAFNHGITAREVANKVGVSERMIRHWRQDDEFHLAVYNCYMKQFDSKLPAILEALSNEALAGNVQAGRLILEHSGKLVKNVVNVTISPYEMFLNKIEGDVVEDVEVFDVAAESDVKEVDLTPKTPEEQRLRVIKEGKKVKEVVDKEEYNAKQREWYKWRKRAEKIGVEPLKNRRPTPAQRKEWQNKIIQAESSKTS